MRLIGPDRIVFLRHIVRELDPAGGVIGGDPLMPFLEEAEKRGADGLVRIAEAEAAGVDSADMGGRFEEHDLRAFAGGGDGRAETARRGTVDDDIGFLGPGEER